MADPESTTGKSPAFQFYPKDFLTDQNVLVMSLAERGAYITLLCLCWSDGSLPADVSKLARLIGLVPSALKKLWPAIEICFRPHPLDQDRLIHPRLERERAKQETHRLLKVNAGKKGGRPKAQVRHRLSTTKAQVKQNLSITKANESSSLSSSSSSSSPICDLLSSEKKTAPPDARSGRPIFKGQRFVVFEWMLDDLRKLLGSHFEEFDVHTWFFTLDAKTEQAAIVLPQRDGGRWLQDQTLGEAARRGLTIAAVQPGTGKTAGNAAAIARFVARHQERA